MADTSSGSEYGKGYGKRPLWQWILLYVIIGGLIYAGVYYFYLSKKGGYTGVYNTTSTTYASPAASPEGSAMAPLASAAAGSPAAAGALVSTKTDPAKGQYLVANNGMTIYVFDEDIKNKSNCNGGCATAWPPYMAVTGAKLPANLIVIKRDDGSSQYAYKGQPVYFYFQDKQVGDTTGDGVGGTWHLVKPWCDLDYGCG